MHTALVAGWPGMMLLYELLTLDPTDPAVNPLWRQGSYVIAFLSRLGVLRSEEAWALAIIRYSQPSWTYELVLGSHLSLAGLALSAGAWHWAYWDLNVFPS
jgi:photosystem II CP47 chlorophyll apoprotein